MSKMLQLRFMRIMLDMAMDFYYYRKMNEDVKKRKMQIVNSVREDVMSAIQREKVTAHDGDVHEA